MQPDYPQITPQPPSRNKLLEIVLPINRSGWSIVAGYVALLNIPFLVTAPISLVLGIIGINDIRKNPSRAGRVRCYFAIVYGAIVTLLLAYFIIDSLFIHPAK